MSPALGPHRTEQSKHGRDDQLNAAQHARAKDLTPDIFANTAFGDDLLQARWSIDFFAERFLGIKPHMGQRRLWDAILMRDGTGWRPRYLDINCAAGNRAGKTLGIAIPLLWSTMFKHGMEPPNPLDESAIKRWANNSYDWYHFAISQEVSELAYIEITRLLAGHHEAQKHGCPLTDAVGEGFADWSKKYRGEYLWIVLNSVFGGGQMHFRTTGEKAIGQLGKDMNGISYDEAGFDPNFNFVVNEVLHLRRLSTGGQLWIIGTSTEGLTDFADRWAEGDPEAPDRKRDSFSLRISTRDNIGFGIDQTMFDRITSTMPRELIPQNIDGFFLQGRSTFFSARSIDDAFVPQLEERTPVMKGHRYVNGVDPATTYDSTWAIVLDVTNAGQGVGVFCDRQMGRTTGPVIAQLTTAAHQAYNVPGVATCETGIDATGFGGKIFRDLLYISPLRSVEFGGTRGRKLKLLNNLKAYFENGKLRFPRTGRWLELRRQLLGYKLEDRRLETDAVMALCVAVYLASQTPEGSVERAPFDYFGVGQPSNSAHGGVAFPSTEGDAIVTSITEFLPRGRE